MAIESQPANALRVGNIVSRDPVVQTALAALQVSSSLFDGHPNISISSVFHGDAPVVKVK